MKTAENRAEQFQATGEWLQLKGSRNGVHAMDSSNSVLDEILRGQALHKLDQPDFVTWWFVNTQFDLASVTTTPIQKPF